MPNSSIQKIRKDGLAVTQDAYSAVNKTNQMTSSEWFVFNPVAVFDTENDTFLDLSEEELNNPEYIASLNSDRYAMLLGEDIENASGYMNLEDYKIEAGIENINESAQEARDQHDSETGGPTAEKNGSDINKVKDPAQEARDQHDSETGGPTAEKNGSDINEVKDPAQEARDQHDSETGGPTAEKNGSDINKVKDPAQEARDQHDSETGGPTAEKNGSDINEVKDPVQETREQLPNDNTSNEDDGAKIKVKINNPSDNLDQDLTPANDQPPRNNTSNEDDGAKIKVKINNPSGNLDQDLTPANDQPSHNKVDKASSDTGGRKPNMEAINWVRKNGRPGQATSTPAFVNNPVSGLEAEVKNNIMPKLGNPLGDSNINVKFNGHDATMDANYNTKTISIEYLNENNQSEIYRFNMDNGSFIDHKIN